MTAKQITAACMYDGNNLLQNCNKNHQQTTKQCKSEADAEPTLTVSNSLHVRMIVQ